MTTVFEDTAGKIRSLPIQPKLRQLLLDAGANCGIDRVRVTSGGQAAKGTPGRRTGSTRHDLGWAADLQLEIGGRALSFVKAAELPYFERFVSLASQLGATGIGAGVDYMGAMTIHVGYGAEAVWGGGGKVANAPRWLREAFASGRALRGQALAAPAVVAAPAASKRYVVTARGGLNVRSRPGIDAAVVGILAAGTYVWCDPAEDAGQWRKVDLHNDGLFDGFAFAAYLQPIQHLSGLGNGGRQ